MNLQIDTERVMSSLRRLAQFGANGTGVCRPALSEDDMAARRWLAAEMRDAGLEVCLDAVGNLYGRTPGVARAVLIGSHSDSVPTGGWLDGALGVIYGLEAARAWRQQCPDAPVGIDVVSFSDEEGRYLSCLGSRSFCGELAAEQREALQYNGRSFADAARAAGLPPDELAVLDPSRHIAYLEAHIEQGPRLDRDNMDIGVVSGIAGMHRYMVSFAGRADHAGTTPMSMRHDAAMAAFEFALACEARLKLVAAADSVWNFGALKLVPGVANVVPKLAELTVELRDISPEVLETLGQSITTLAAEYEGRRAVSVSVQRQGTLAPAMMAPALRDMFTAAADRAQTRHMVMHSGAIHDAMLLARHIPTGMLFVPSIDGRSHTPVENTSDAHIELGARVFFDSVTQVLNASA